MGQREDQIDSQQGRRYGDIRRENVDMASPGVNVFMGNLGSQLHGYLL